MVDLDDKRAKILTVNLNEMKGQSLPTLLANLVHDLSKELVLEDLEKQLPYSLDELKDSLDLLKIPDGLDEFLKQETQRQARERPQILTFVVDDAEPVERAIEAAKREHGIGTRGEALVAIAHAYLAGWSVTHERGRPTPSEGAGPPREGPSSTTIPLACCEQDKQAISAE